MSNCLIFVLRRWLRRGGFIVMRQSEYGWWPHFLWSRDLVEFEEYTPAVPNHHLKLPPLLYRGIEKRWAAVRPSLDSLTDSQ